MTLVVAMITMTSIPYYVGRILRIHRRHQSVISCMSDSSLLNTTTIEVQVNTTGSKRPTTNDAVDGGIWNDDTTMLFSGTCQSFGMDIDQMDEHILQSPMMMETKLSKMIAHDFFDTSHLHRTPHCEPRLSLQQQQHDPHPGLYCDAILSNAMVHLYT